MLSMTLCMPAFTARTVRVEDYWAHIVEDPTEYSWGPIRRMIGTTYIGLGAQYVFNYTGTFGEGTTTIPGSTGFIMQMNQTHGAGITFSRATTSIEGKGTIDSVSFGKITLDLTTFDYQVTSRFALYNGTGDFEGVKVYGTMNGEGNRRIAEPYSEYWFEGTIIWPN
jgi:hypothetical protein